MSGHRSKLARREAEKARSYLGQQFDRKNAGIPVTLWRRLAWIFWPPKRLKDVEAWKALHAESREAFITAGLKKLSHAAADAMRGQAVE